VSGHHNGYVAASNVGSFSGWQVGAYAGAWRWTAWGPHGSESGEATSKQEAETRAAAAERRLKEKRPC